MLTQNHLEGIYTYTTEKVPVIGSCELLVLHPDDKCFLKLPFHVVSVEGSVIVPCATSINLNLIQIHNELDTNIPDCARLYYISANKPSANQEQQKKVDHTAKCDKNCQDTNFQAVMPANKNCQENNMQTVHSILQTYSRLCQDQTYQSTRCSKKISDPHKRQKVQNDKLQEPSRYKSGCSQYNLSPRWYKFQARSYNAVQRCQKNCK